MMPFISLVKLTIRSLTSSRPNKDDLTPERLEYWAKRSRDTKNPILK